MSLSFIQHTALSICSRPRLNSVPLPSITRLNRPVHSRAKTTRAIPVMSATDRKMLHAVYRVGDLDATRKFLGALGMQVLRERDVPSEKYTNVFFGFGPEQRGEFFSLELTYNYGINSYDVGTGFGHFSVAVPDVSKTLDALKLAGFVVSRPSSPGPDGAISADVVDPTGYTFELIERNQRDPLCQLMLRTAEIEKSIKFYEAMGMKVLKKLDDAKSTRVFMGFGPENDSTLLQLLCAPGEQSFTAGDGYAQIAVSCPDVYEAAKQFEDAGITVTRAPGPVPGIGTKICAVRDPDGWKTVMVDAEDFEKEFQ